MIHLRKQVRTFLALVRRDLIMVRQGFYDDLINAFVHVTATYIALGILGPYLGFTVALARDVMIGGIASIFLSRGFGSAIVDSFDMSDTRYIDYKRTLPLSTQAMLLASLCTYVLFLFASSLPLFLLSKLYLGALMPLDKIQWSAFCVIYLLSMIFISAFFLCLIFFASFDWFRFNVWQRILIPLNTLGCFMFSWKRLSDFSPLFARFLLCNPFTYIAEGLRASLFGNEFYICIYYCIPVLFVWTVMTLFVLLVYIRKRVDAGL